MPLCCTYCRRVEIKLFLGDLKVVKDERFQMRISKQTRERLEKIADGTELNLTEVVERMIDIFYEDLNIRKRLDKHSQEE